LFEIFEHGQAWNTATPPDNPIFNPVNEFKIKERIPVEKTNDGFRVWADQQHTAVIPNLSRLTRDCDDTDSVYGGYSDVEDFADDRDPAGRGLIDSTHLRFLETDPATGNPSVVRKNETRLIVCKGLIEKARVEDTGINEWTHTIKLDVDQETGYFVGGDEVWIQSSYDTIELDKALIRGTLLGPFEIGPGSPFFAEFGAGPVFQIKSSMADHNPNQDLACPTDRWMGCNQQAMIYNRNRFAISMSDAIEDEPTKFLKGHEIEITEKNGTSKKTYTISNRDDVRGLIDIDGDLGEFAHIDVKLSFSHEPNTTTAAAASHSLASGNLDELPLVRNLTVPCYIKIKSKTSVPDSWMPEEEHGVFPYRTEFVFDSRLGGQIWSLRQRNLKEPSIFYVEPKDDSGTISMLCNECDNDSWRLVGDDAIPLPEDGPRSLTALPRAAIGGLKAIRENIINGPPPAEDGIVNVEYKPGQLDQDANRTNDAVDTEEQDYWAYNSGYFWVGERHREKYGKRVDYIIVTEGTVT